MDLNEIIRKYNLKTYAPILLIGIFIIFALLIFLFKSHNGLKSSKQVSILPKPTAVPTRTPAQVLKDAQKNASESAKIYTITSGKFQRTYIIHIPKLYDGIHMLPVIFAYHGGGDDASNMEKFSGFSELGDKYGFFTVYPNGYQNRWADGRGVGPGDALGISDIQFTHDIIKDISKKYKIDPVRLYATGFSAGGYFVHKLACEDSATFSGFATVGASLPANIEKNCQPSNPRSILLIMGTNDPSYAGWTTDTGIYIHSAAESIQKWAALNHCPKEPTVSEGKDVKVTQYKSCDKNSRVGLLTLRGIGHDWISGPTEKTFDTARVIIGYFSGYELY